MGRLLLAILFCSSSLFAQNYKVKTGSVSWLAKGEPGFLQITGEGGELSGQANIEAEMVSGAFTLGLTSYTTGLKLRDKHMHETYLETKRFPLAKLSFKKVKFSLGDEFSWEGTLELKGVVRPVKGTGVILGEQPEKRFRAQFEVNLEDYPIGVPSYMGVSVAKHVEVKIEGLAN